MLMTGTLDDAAIGTTTAAERRLVYPALAGAPKYELVLDHAEHSAFTERALPGDREPRRPGHHRSILALSTAFWDTYLRQDATAAAWLHDQTQVRTVLDPADTWQFALP
jgi:hypothetical protein